MLDANERHLPSALLHCALCPEADPSGQHQQAPLVRLLVGMAIGRHWPENGGQEEREVGSLSHPNLSVSFKLPSILSFSGDSESGPLCDGLFLSSDSLRVPLTAPAPCPPGCG